MGLSISSKPKGGYMLYLLLIFSFYETLSSLSNKSVSHQRKQLKLFVVASYWQETDSDRLGILGVHLQFSQACR